MSGIVVVGYDKSGPSEQALLLAAQEAAWRHTSLMVIHAYHYPQPATPAVFTAPVLQEVYAKAAEEIAETGAEHAKARYPGLDVRPRADIGLAAHVLALASRDAGLLVVGNRGRGGFAGLLLGSVSARVLGASDCPVIVARGEGIGQQRNRIVAAVDIDDPCCADILAFAAEEAVARDAELLALHVWDDENHWVMDESLDAAGLMKSVSEVVAELDAGLAAPVGQVRDRHPGIDLSHRIATGPVGQVLVEESGHADLIAVGARKRGGGHHGQRVGPVATTLLHHAGCPVAVVPHG